MAASRATSTTWSRPPRVAGRPPVVWAGPGRAVCALACLCGTSLGVPQSARGPGGPSLCVGGPSLCMGFPSLCIPRIPREGRRTRARFPPPPYYRHLAPRRLGGLPFPLLPGRPSIGMSGPGPGPLSGPVSALTTFGPARPGPAVWRGAGRCVTGWGAGWSRCSWGTWAWTSGSRTRDATPTRTTRPSPSDSRLVRPPAAAAPPPPPPPSGLLPRAPLSCLCAYVLRLREARAHVRACARVRVRVRACVRVSTPLFVSPFPSWSLLLFPRSIRASESSLCVPYKPTALGPGCTGPGLHRKRGGVRGSGGRGGGSVARFSLPRLRRRQTFDPHRRVRAARPARRFRRPAHRHRQLAGRVAGRPAGRPFLEK